MVVLYMVFLYGAAAGRVVNAGRHRETGEFRHGTNLGADFPKLKNQKIPSNERGFFLGQHD